VAKEEDYLKLDSIAHSTKNALLITLIVPFFFMLFMKISMERVWSFYNML